MIRPAWSSNPDSLITIARQRVLRRYQQRHRDRHMEAWQSHHSESLGLSWFSSNLCCKLSYVVTKFIFFAQAFDSGLYMAVITVHGLLGKKMLLFFFHAELLIQHAAGTLTRLLAGTIILCRWMTSNEALNWFVLLIVLLAVARGAV